MSPRSFTRPPVFGPYMTQYFNTLSRCPALSVPSGVDRNGVPTGVQIVGPSFEEAAVFRIGMALEEASPEPFFIDLRPPLG